MLGAKIVARHEVQRPRQRPESRLELSSLSAGKTLVPLAGVAFEQQRDVGPVTSLALRHGGKRDVERAVRAKEISRRMKRETGEGRAPARVAATFTGGVHCVGGPLILHEIANALSGNPTIARYPPRSLPEPFQ